jgi:hypothetical protein
LPVKFADNLPFIQRSRDQPLSGYRLPCESHLRWITIGA